MSEKETKRKRRWGDRRDARLVKAPGLQTIMGYLWPKRTDCEVYINDKVAAARSAAACPPTERGLCRHGRLRAASLRPPARRSAAQRRLPQVRQTDSAGEDNLRYLRRQDPAK